MRCYRFVWKDGSTNVGEGETPEEAFTALGFGAGAVPALDYHEELKTEEEIEKAMECLRSVR